MNAADRRIDYGVKRFFRALPFLVSALVMISGFAALLPRSEEKVSAERVVRVWNVDTFEGGRGSRVNFLKSAARSVEKTRKGVVFLISAYSLAGAEEAFARGDMPDAISFGVGLSAFAEKSLPLPYTFVGGTLGGKPLAYPWCRGEYALFSLSEDFSEEGKTAISLGGSNLPEVAARLEGIEGEALPSLTAYTRFLSGEYRYLLGTQRDKSRFSARGVNVFSRPLTAFCDLYQYYSVLSAEHREDCIAFLEELLSGKTQAKLTELGMYPISGEGAPSPPKRTVGVFASRLEDLLQAAREMKNLENYLKTV